MTQKRLNNLLLLHVHKDRTDGLDLREAGQQFVGANERRKNIFAWVVYLDSVQSLDT